MSRSALVYYIGSIFFSLGCAPAASRAPVVPFTELAQRPLPALDREPLIVRFEAGERIPVQLDVQAPFLRTELAPPPVMLVATRRFFVLIDPREGVKLSEDGVHFSANPRGSFRFGLQVTPAGSRVEVGLALRKM